MTELVQNTQEWHEWRHKGIGASEVPIIMGLSRFKTKKELWAQKINPTPPKEEENNFIHEKGHELERVARNKLELETFDDWKPKLVVHGENERLRASLDGYNSALNAVWECKYLGLDKYKTLQNASLTDRERIPEEYWPQLMHQVLVTNCEWVYFTGIVDSKVLKTLEKGQTEQFTLKFKVNETHKKYIYDEMLPEIVDFLSCIDEKKEPGLSDKDEVILKDAELKKKMTKYKNIKVKLDKLAKEEKALKEEIFAETLKTHNRVIVSGHKIVETKSEDKIAPDYERYVKEYGLEDAVINNGFTKVVKGRKMRKITLNLPKEK